VKIYRKKVEDQSVKLSFLSAYLAKVIHPLSRIIWSMKSIGVAWNTIQCTTKVSDGFDGCRVCNSRFSKEIVAKLFF